MRCTPLGVHVVRQGLHLLGVGHIDTMSHHGHPRACEFCDGRIERVTLHIDQHQVHAKLGTQARTFQTKARSRAGQDRCFARKV